MARLTLEDLASQKFTLGDEYNNLQDAAYIQMQKAVWNLLIMKCCTYYKTSLKTFGAAKGAVTQWAQTKFYPYHKGSYFRAILVDTNPDQNWNYYEGVYWDLGIGGYPFPDEASSVLFMDDTPGHLINLNEHGKPTGLFPRSYVFEQFSTTKPRFLRDYHELATDPGQDFATLADDWEYTGGMFPRLADIG